VGAGQLGHSGRVPANPPIFTRFCPFQADNRRTAMPQCTGSRTGHAGHGVVGRHEFPLAVGSALDLDLAFSQPPRADQDLPRDADQVGGREFRAGPLVQVMIEGVEPLAARAA